MIKTIGDGVKYIGIEDKTIDLFESQYTVKYGVTYNSYVILDEKIAVFETADWRVTNEWMELLKEALEGKTPDYLVISHMEPDHSSNIKTILEMYPNITLVGNAKTFQILGQFVRDVEFKNTLVVKEGDILDLGKHKLKIMLAPMVHWPEVMMEYDEYDKILFSADAFGRFGPIETEYKWEDFARRYYFNIVGKYGPMVQKVLAAAANLDIKTIAPVHGPYLDKDLNHYLGLYKTWSSFAPEAKGVAIAYASLHGNTKKFAKLVEEEFKKAGIDCRSFDLNREDLSEAVEYAFKYDKLLLAAPTYDGGLACPMKDFITRLEAKTWQQREVALIENGSWGPLAAKKMRELLEGFKGVTIRDEVITIKSTPTKENIEQINGLIEWAKNGN